MSPETVDKTKKRQPINRPRYASIPEDERHTDEEWDALMPHCYLVADWKIFNEKPETP